MRTYTAHLRPAQPPILVKEGFAWGAALFGPLWLAAHRAWIPAVACLAAVAGLAILHPPLMTALAVALMILLGVFGRDLVRWSLGRRGYALAHVVAGRNTDDAFLRLLDHAPEFEPGLAPEIAPEFAVSPA